VGYPWILNNLRIAILKRRGLTIGKDVYVDPYASIDAVHPYLITIADKCILTKGVTILAHDASTNRHFGFTRIGKVSIGEKTFIGLNSVVLPGVRIGKKVIIGAGSIVTHDIPDNCVAFGVPARVISSTSEFIAKHQENFKTHPVFVQTITAPFNGSNVYEKKPQVIKQKINEGDFGYFGLYSALEYKQKNLEPSVDS
jgi:maltose O-acetyltransferase